MDLGTPKGVYYKPGFGVSGVTSDLTLGFQCYDGGSILTRLMMHN